ncbi:zf-HC2 domain-containing protein [Lipingzhangella sp. LS1_29]|uniref:Zf-HC2 domain-containing protein n=1 Tax=Lipingzhangella rawalii TaxID=2055835 RepID=A0ABU2H7Q6_9ACTN|nr:zf-HC2 domain-containing protein [Lipingzhangella rawalii]MDS1271343.1 zf-HC2 domain-containing protein [Lipingzhangella rawalii]
MSTTEHDSHLLGAYVLGTLDVQESTQVEAHLEECARCRDEVSELRQVREALGELPPEALLDGPPENDLPLQRTVRQVRSQRLHQSRRQWFVLTAVAVLAGVVLIGGSLAVGAALGAGSGEEPAVPELDAGTVVAAQENPDTGAAATVALAPSEDGTQVDSLITGLPAGEDCEIVVLAEDGTSTVAAEWTVTPEAAEEGSEPGGLVDVRPEEVASVVVRNVEHTEFLTVPF